MNSKFTQEQLIDMCRAAGIQIHKLSFGHVSTKTVTLGAIAEVIRQATNTPAPQRGKHMEPIKQVHETFTLATTYLYDTGWMPIATESELGLWYHSSVPDEYRSIQSPITIVGVYIIRQWRMVS